VAPYPSVLAVEVSAAWIWRSYFLWRMLGAYSIIAHFADNVELFMRTYIALPTEKSSTLKSLQLWSYDR
jgi:hypothetical protein